MCVSSNHRDGPGIGKGIGTMSEQGTGNGTAFADVLDFVRTHKETGIEAEKAGERLPRNAAGMLNLIHDALRDARFDETRGDMLHTCGVCADAIKILVMEGYV